VIHRRVKQSFFVCAKEESPVLDWWCLRRLGLPLRRKCVTHGQLVWVEELCLKGDRLDELENHTKRIKRMLERSRVEMLADSERTTILPLPLGVLSESQGSMKWKI